MARKNKGWALAIELKGTQEAVAEALGIKQHQVSEYLTGRRRCRVDRAIMLEKKFGVPRWMTRPDVFKREKA